MANLNDIITDGTAKFKVVRAATTQDINDSKVYFATCSTGGSTAAKTVTATGFSLVTGAKIIVKFTNANTAANPTLNVNSTGAKAIYQNGAAIAANVIIANGVYEFVYNGTQFDLVSGASGQSVIVSSTEPTNKNCIWFKTI